MMKQLFFALAAVALGSGATLAQGLDAQGARETIIDALVETAEKPVAAENDRIVAAIGESAPNAEEIRKRSHVERVEIVVVPGLAESDSPLRKTLDDNKAAIDALRAEIEGSAIFFHAVDSQQVLLRDVVAVEFGTANDVTIFVAGRVQN